jgi:hypothetical protein
MNDLVHQALWGFMSNRVSFVVGRTCLVLMLFCFGAADIAKLPPSVDNASVTTVV